VRPLALAVLVAAVTSAQQGDSVKKWTPANYVRELRYTCYPDKVHDMLQYFTRLAEADAKLNSGRMRWVDALPYGQLVISNIPAYHLSEYDARVDSGMILAKAFGDEEYHKLGELYINAQERTESVIRKYRDDLSINRDKYLRANMKIARHNYVTVKPGKVPLFEEAARELIAALTKIAPDMVMSCAQTISGSGPHYLFVVPFASYAELQNARIPATAVEAAFGKEEAAKWAAKVTEAVENTEYVLMQKAAKDSFVP